MAPKILEQARAPPKSNKASHSNALLANLKSSIHNTKAKLSALRTSGTGKVVKTTTEREHLKRVIERLSIIDGRTSSKRSSLRYSSDPSPHIPLKKSSTLAPQDFEVGGILGKGKFGRVFLARHLATDYICALKIISKAQCSNKEEEMLIRREIEVHQNLAHKNILKLLSWFHDDKNIYLVLEFASGGSLFSRLKKQPNGRFDEHTAAQYVAQMAEALRYMHSKRILHRDIKAENILLGFHNEIKLADFGYSVHSESGFRSTVCGTLDYLSPEMAIMMLKPGKDKDFYTKAIDQWSLGVLTYELLVGKPPFEMKSTHATQKKIANYKGKGIKFPSYVARDAEDLIRDLLNMDAEKRLGFDDVLKHPWITRHVEKSVQSGLRSFNHMLERAT
ncbi:kinase-like domain-containing protein [Ampelomyces quisqualis]|uniref:Aurora kinase n=1 Tax=Ampelomyces quisqualis TaxID=50730 RepID=A0A6A5R302_AMPQU|nr:kinase-like domain-containing protein [Ampelomyces quisqualis]